MILTKETLQEWKAELNTQVQKRLKYEHDDYSSCFGDKEWLTIYEGKSVEDCIQDEMEGSDWEEITE